MAVYTRIDDQTLTNFLKKYDIGKATSFKGIAEGVENSNFLLSTTKGQYILTVYEKRADPEDLPYFLNMMEHVADKGLPSPRPIRDKTGNCLQILEGKPACLISFLSGVSIEQTSDPYCAELGATLAKMHTSLSDFSENRPNELSLAGWQTLISDVSANADKVSTGLQAFINEEFSYLKAHWPKDLPTGTIHADLFPDNVLFTGHSVTGIIDFYFGCTDAFAYDLAICINAWCFDENHTFVPSRAKRMTEMYDAHRSLTPAELEALPILCRGAAFRFLLTRLYDLQNQVAGAVVNIKDPMDYAKRIEFHRTVKDTASYVV